MSKNYESMRAEIYDMCGPAAMYEGLAEEASELAQAASKVARIIRGENPTPVTLNDAKEDLIEELTDVIIMCDIIGMEHSSEVYKEKLERMHGRVKDACC